MRYRITKLDDGKSEEIELYILTIEEVKAYIDRTVGVGKALVELVELEDCTPRN